MALIEFQQGIFWRSHIISRNALATLDSGLGTNHTGIAIPSPSQGILGVSPRVRIFHVDVPGLPIPWTVYIRGRGAPNKSFVAMQEWQLAIQIAVRAAYPGQAVLTGPVHLDMAFMFPVPLSAPQKKPYRGHWIRSNIAGRGDLRNYEKAAEDALQGVLLKNDRQVVSSYGWKGWDIAGQGLTWMNIVDLSNDG